jgi:hypothetical protein
MLFVFEAGIQAGHPQGHGKALNTRIWLFALSGGIGLRIRGHPPGPPLAQKLIMISPPPGQEEGTISRRLEHKSFISKRLESKVWFIALSDGMVTGLA